MKKVLALSTSYPLRTESVSGIFVHNLYRSMADSWSIEVLCPDDSRQCSGRLDGIRITPVRYAPKRLQVLGGSGGIMPSLKANPFKLLLLPLMLASLYVYTLFKARSADLIHANWAICGAIASCVGLVFRKPVVTTLRGDDVVRAGKSLLDRMLLRLAVFGSDKIFCVSQAMVEQMQEMFPRRKDDICCGLNGVDPSFFDLMKTRGDTDCLHMVCIGSLIHRKGFDLVIMAMARLKGSVNLRLSIAGDGPEKSSLLHLATENEVYEQISFCGEISPEEVRSLLSVSDVFVLPSRSEGRPNALIEAVAAGLPVICADLPGVSGLVINGVNGWIFPSGNHMALADALRTAWANSEKLQEIGGQGQLAMQDSGWEHTASQYEVVFNQLVQSSLHANDGKAR